MIRSGRVRCIVALTLALAGGARAQDTQNAQQDTQATRAQDAPRGAGDTIGEVIIPHPRTTPDVAMPTGDAARGIPMPTGLIGHDTYRERRKRLMEQMGGGVAIIFAAPAVDRDTRQDLDFYYLTGLEHEGGAALLLAPENTETPEVLFLKALDVEDNLWHGERASLGRAVELGTGFKRVRRMNSLPGTLAREITRAKDMNVHFLGPIVGYSSAVPRSLQVARDATSRIPGARITLSHELLPAMRQAKDDKELELTRRAIDATRRGLKAAMTEVRPGMTEFQLRMVIESAFRKAGSRRNAFDSIVGSGPNSCVLHYTGDDRTMQAGDLVLCDVGAEVEMYAADITRTFPVSGRFTTRQREVYDIVLKAADAAIAAARPGVTLRELNDIARQIIEDAGYTDNFPHGLSHFLGLNVHDAGLYDMPLAPGVVFTIEPGIYIAEEQIGIRIEDDILITAEGSEVLSSGLPRTADEVEAFMAAARASASANGQPEPANQGN